MSSSRVRDSSLAIPPLRLQCQNFKMFKRRLIRLSALAGWTTPEHELMREKPTRKTLCLNGQGRLF